VRMYVLCEHICVYLHSVEKDKMCKVVIGKKRKKE
jgi:hypothetical protein